MIQASQRQRRSSGQWGKIKPLKIRPGELDQIEHEDDRVFLSYLAGAIPERNNWSTQQAELRAAAHRFHLPYELGTLILPEMCRSGRLAIASEDEKARQMLEWDEGDPWDLTVKVKKNIDGSGWNVVGMLVRADESMELSEIPLVVPGGFVITSRFHCPPAGLLGRPSGFVCSPAKTQSRFPKPTSMTLWTNCWTCRLCRDWNCPKNCSWKKSTPRRRRR